MGRPFADATFPLTSHDIGAVARFRLFGMEYKHQISIITVNSADSMYPDYLTGSPVIVEWGTTDRSDTFVGYVLFAQAATIPSAQAPALLPGGSAVDIYCIGATFPMNEARQQVYTGLTGDQIVARVSKQYQLDVFTEPDDRVWGSYGQAGLSDWSFMVSLAHDIGYTLYAKGTQVRFHSRTLEVLRGASSALTYDYTGTDNNNPVPSSRQVLQFNPTVGNLGSNEEKRKRRVLYDLDRRTGAIISVQDHVGPTTLLGPQSLSPQFTEFITANSADSLSEGIFWVTDMREDQRWYITADAVVQGDVRLGPAQPVYFKNLPADFTGYWYIRGVEHDIQTWPGKAGEGLVASYTTALTLGRDAIGSSVDSPSSSPFRTTNQLIDLGSPTESATTSQLMPSGYWRASFQTNN